MGYNKKNHKRDVFVSPKIPKKFISTKVNDQKIGVHKNLTKWPSPARGRLKSLAKKSHKRASARLCQLKPQKHDVKVKNSKKNPQKGVTEATKTTKTGKVFLVLLV